MSAVSLSPSVLPLKGSPALFASIQQGAPQPLIGEQHPRPPPPQSPGAAGYLPQTAGLSAMPPLPPTDSFDGNSKSKIQPQGMTC